MSVERAGRFVEDAYRLTELGWSLIRLDGKIPKGKDWQHTKPLRDPHQAAGMWAEWGKRWNMGVVLGPSRLCVVEYDRDEAEPVLLELLGGDWPTTPTARTGSGRRHLYFEVPPNGVVKAARDGLELRLGAHQCVLPPSEHPDTGVEYVWELEPWSTPLLTVPAGALAFFAAATDELRERLHTDPDAKVHPGQRRDQVFRLACSLVARGVPPDAILTAARAFNETRCEPPLEDEQVVAQVDGAVERYEPATVLPSPSIPRYASERTPAGLGAKTSGPPTLAWERLSEIEMRSIVFLDKPLWQASAFHLVVGRKGVGKGTALADLTARVTRGDLGAKRNVVWIGSEDSASIDIKPRIVAAGGAPERVALIKDWIQLPRDVQKLGHTLAEIGDVGLLIIDPVGNHITRRRGVAPSRPSSERARGCRFPVP